MSVATAQTTSTTPVMPAPIASTGTAPIRSARWPTADDASAVTTANSVVPTASAPRLTSKSSAIGRNSTWTVDFIDEPAMEMTKLTVVANTANAVMPDATLGTALIVLQIRPR